MLSCLASAPTKPEITCLNYYWDDSLVDERVFARAIAHSTRARLLELRFGTENRLSMLRSVKRTPAPVLDVIDWQESARERSLAREANATAIFMGSLGDSIFERNPCMYAASDYLRTRGVDLGFFRTLLTVAMYQRRSVWKSLMLAIREVWSSSRRNTWSTQEEAIRHRMLKQRNFLVDEEAIASLQTTSRTRVHPWLRNVDDVPAAKLWLVSGLFADAFYDRHFVADDDPPIIAAFMSQPLVELCLRIPSHLNIRGGFDRAMARAAFAGELPEATLHRSSKGSPETWLRAMVTRDTEFIREFLLDGMLVKERVVNRERLESALPGRISTRASGAGSIMNLLYTEAWLRAWSGASGVHST
jgi:asparagine synthase (glutamine-hydrolysing)